MQVEALFAIVLLCCGGLLVIEVITSLRHGEAVGCVLVLIGRTLGFFLYPFFSSVSEESPAGHALRGTLWYTVIVFTNSLLATIAIVGGMYLLLHDSQYVRSLFNS